MSKRAEEASLKAYPISTPPSYLDGHYLLRQEAFIKGYEQAEKDINKEMIDLMAKYREKQEKALLTEHNYDIYIEQAEDDLALTWEDMAKIDAIILDVNNEFAVDYSKEINRQKFYEEVLKRFKEAKK